MRRLALLAALLAVPAIAAETAFEPAIAQAPQTAIQPMGFETPGESFPGSAFYYLEDPLPAAPVAARGAMQGAAAPSHRVAETSLHTGPAASALVASGAATDIVRAQECLTTAIYHEAASENDAGQRAVAQVVLNRVAHDAWPDTVCGVVFEGSARTTGCQFSFTCDGSLARRPSRSGWDRASRVARAALAGFVYAPVGLSTHYHTLAVKPYWAPTLSRTTVIGAHVFYRWPGAAGERGAFAFTYGGGEPLPGRAASAGFRIADAAVAPAASAVQSARPVPGAMPAAPSAPQAAVALQEPDTGRLPVSGAVRSEYANAGRWIQQP